MFAGSWLLSAVRTGQDITAHGPEAVWRGPMAQTPEHRAPRKHHYVLFMDLGRHWAAQQIECPQKEAAHSINDTRSYQA